MPRWRLAGRVQLSHGGSRRRPNRGGVAAAITHWNDALQAAATEANSAAVGVAHTLGDPVEPPSCTFVAAVVAESLIAVAWCGDSRAYWLPDSGEGAPTDVDHSLGTEMLAAGKSRAEWVLARLLTAGFLATGADQRYRKA